MLFIGIFEGIGNLLEKTIRDLIGILEEANSLPIYIQNVGLALLGILIPLAIAILTEVYRKRGSPEEELSELDLQVILDGVFRVKRLVFYTLLIFLPCFFWDILSSGFYRLLELFLSLIGILMVLKTIFDVYYWTKGNAFKYRFNHLKKLDNPADLEVAWRSVWKSKSVNIQNELEFFKIFSSVIDEKLPEKKNLMAVTKLLDDFRIFIGNRSSYFLVASDKVFPKMLNWNYVTWKMEQDYINRRKEGEDLHVWMHLFEILRILKYVIECVEKRALEEGNTSYLFMKHLREHINIHKNEYNYVEYLLKIFYNVYFEKVPTASERFAIWECFPEEWKITKRNIECKDNLEARITLKICLDWVLKRIREAKEDYDRELEDVSYNMFPEVDPKLWAVILIFAFSPYAVGNRVKSVVERKWTFGLLPRAKAVYGDLKENFEEVIRLQELAEVKNTYELAILLFPEVYSKELLEKYREEAEKLKYPDGSEEERKRLKLREIFQGMFNVLSQKA
ncbi:MAG: hypothetical protein QW707_01745 [Candidatus Bathyarchaeia archaeon]